MTKMAVVQVEREGALLIVTIDRPERRNAVNAAVSDAIADAMARLDADPEIVVGILTGAGGVFCAGADLRAFSEGEAIYGERGGFGGLTEALPKKPLIAAVEGFALAGGCELALSCDLIVAAENARFGLPEVKRGLIASAGGLMRLPKRIPYHLAMEIALTGEPITAADAARYGLVNRLVPAGSALAEAKALALQIAANAPLSLIASKQVIQESAMWPPERMFAEQAPIAERIGKSADALEGATAFVEKRAARWRGC